MADPKGALAEKIAFLAQFANRGRTLSDPIIELLPLNNRLGKDDTESKRALTFDEERRLAEAFALILATTDKPSRVGAVCIEEQPNSSGFAVRFAANSGTLEKEKEVLFNKIINAARLAKPSGVFTYILALTISSAVMRAQNTYIHVWTSSIAVSYAIR